MAAQYWSQTDINFTQYFGVTYGVYAAELKKWHFHFDNYTM